MKDFSKYQGIFPAFYACYDDKGNVSPERVRPPVSAFISPFKSANCCWKM